MIKINLKNNQKINQLTLAVILLGFIISLFIHWILAIGFLIYLFWRLVNFSISWLAVFSLVGFFIGVILFLANFDNFANLMFGLVFTLLIVLAMIRLSNDNQVLDVKEQNILQNKKTRRNFSYIIANVLMVTGYILVFNIIPETSLLWHMTLLGILIILANFIIWQYEITK